MKFTIFFYVALALIAVKFQEIQSAILSEYGIADKNLPKQLKDPGWASFSSGILKAYGTFGKYPTESQINVTLSAPSGCVLIAAIRVLDLRPNNEDTLTLFDVGSPKVQKTFRNSASYKSTFEDKTETQNVFLAPNGQLGVSFKTGRSKITAGYKGFELVYTVQANAPCQDINYFVCKNGRCINDFLTCDGHNHCGDRSDQADCGLFPGDLKATAGRIVGIVFGVIVSLIVVIGLIVFIIFRRAAARKRTQGGVISNPGYR